ncbi:MAG: outer membrane beta-barrel protein [Deltaproteobacteria bacterium]|nr:outer membrane beta-barrel protein [Deltaproteobacteria bacterium]MBW2384917.1 outer membrane beta-barrel protein [Deltaproteobacteria bacterium]MBW2698661.1 outer membrane beta-barrel protein [Deltaproteobacteria bacterium]
MRSMARVFVLVGGIVAMIAGAANAQNYSGHQWVDTGGYLFLGGMTAWENFEDTGNIGDPRPAADFSTSLGFTIKGGYRFMPYLAAEVEGNFLSGFDTLVNVPAGQPPGVPPVFPLTVDGGAITFNALAYFPLGRIQPHAIFGLGGNWMNLRTTYPVATVCSPSWYYWWYCRGVYAQLRDGGGFVIRAGLGLDVNVSEDWAIVVDATYVKPFGDLESLPYINMNWGVRFNF